MITKGRHKGGRYDKDNDAPPPPGVGGNGGWHLVWSRQYRLRLEGKEAGGNWGGIHRELAFLHFRPSF